MNWKEILEGALYIVLTIVLPIVVKFLLDFLSAKAGEAIAKQDNVQLQKYLNMALDIVNNTVTYVSQTYVDALKAEGKFDEESAALAFTIAKERAFEMMSDELLKFIKTTYGDIDKWLETTIEATVKNQKVYSAPILEGTAILDE